jgi:hypothetical protein
MERQAFDAIPLGAVVQIANDLDARDRRLRAALTAVLVRDNAPELPRMRE